MSESNLLHPYTDEGVLDACQDRMEAGEELSALPDIVLIDRLRFRLECALNREQTRVDEARLTAQRTITRSQYTSMLEMAARGRKSDLVDDMLQVLGITIIEG